MMLEILTSDAIKVQHGFFTRKGGASSGIFAGLNCGPGSSDQSDIVSIIYADRSHAWRLLSIGAAVGPVRGLV